MKIYFKIDESFLTGERFIIEIIDRLKNYNAVEWNDGEEIIVEKREMSRLKV